MSSETELTELTEAALHYTSDTGLRTEREWASVEAEIRDAEIVASGLPAAANTWLLTVTDERGAMVSSAVGFR